MQLKVESLVHLVNWLQKKPSACWHVQVSGLLQIENLLQPLSVRLVDLVKKCCEIVIFVLSVPNLILELSASILQVQMEVSAEQMSQDYAFLYQIFYGLL